MDVTDWEARLDQGDSALARGDAGEAEIAYDALSIDLEPADSPSDLLLKAVVMHRMGVIKLVTGEVDIADEYFTTVVDLTATVERAATPAPVQSYARSLAQQSHRHRQQVMQALPTHDSVDLVRLPEEVRTLIGVCQHGCPSIEVPCDYDGPHC